MSDKSEAPKLCPELRAEASLLYERIGEDDSALESFINFAVWKRDQLERELAAVTEERDALAAAMPSEGADAALAYAAEKTLREKAEAECERLREALESLRSRHYECEDRWYSCPESEDGCADDRQGDECNCGANRRNEIIDAALARNP